MRLSSSLFLILGIDEVRRCTQVSLSAGTIHFPSRPPRRRRTNRDQSILHSPLPNSHPLALIAPVHPVSRPRQIKRLMRSIGRGKGEKHVSVLARLGRWARGLVWHYLFYPAVSLVMLVVLASTQCMSIRGDQEV